MKIHAAVDLLSALAQDSRLAAVRLLVKAGPEGLAAGDLAAALDVPAPTLSFHLSQLANADLVVARREGRSIIYAVRFETLRRLLQFLMEDCCQGRPEVCGPPAGAGRGPISPKCRAPRPKETVP